MAILWKLQFLLPALGASGASPKCHAFKGKPVWVRYFRRGCTKELQFTRAESPKLCGALLRAVSSEGGEPGSCWTQFPVDRRSWKQLGVQCKGISFPKYGKYPTTMYLTLLGTSPQIWNPSPPQIWNPWNPVGQLRRRCDGSSIYSQHSPDGSRTHFPTARAGHKSHPAPGGYQNRDTIGEPQEVLVHGRLKKDAFHIGLPRKESVESTTEPDEALSKGPPCGPKVDPLVYPRIVHDRLVFLDCRKQPGKHRVRRTNWRIINSLLRSTLKPIRSTALLGT